MTTDSSTPPDGAYVLAVLTRDPATQVIRRLFEEEGLAVEVRDPAEGPQVWRNGQAAQAVIVDESLEPSEVADAIESGLIPNATPLFVLARRLPDRDRYQAWLETGAWDIVKIPLEGVALALRLQNILAGRLPGAGRPANQRYGWADLVAVTDETLHLSIRYGRPFHCVAVSGRLAAGNGPVGDGMLNRFADVAQRFTRRSDLIGLGPGVLLILLPDTDLPGALTFQRRFEETLAARIESWGEPVTLRTAIASAAERSSGEELLESAIAALSDAA